MRTNYCQLKHVKCLTYLYWHHKIKENKVIPLYCLTLWNSLFFTLHCPSKWILLSSYKKMSQRGAIWKVTCSLVHTALEASLEASAQGVVACGVGVLEQRGPPQGTVGHWQGHLLYRLNHLVQCTYIQQDDTVGKIHTYKCMNIHASVAYVNHECVYTCKVICTAQIKLRNQQISTGPQQVWHKEQKQYTVLYWRFTQRGL